MNTTRTHVALNQVPPQRVGVHHTETVLVMDCAHKNGHWHEKLETIQMAQ